MYRYGCLDPYSIQLFREKTDGVEKTPSSVLLVLYSIK